MTFHPTLTPRELARAQALGPAAAEAMLDHVRSALSADVAFALFPVSGAEPQLFPELKELAREIHRLRRGAALQLVDDELMLRGATRPRRVVTVYLQDETGSRTDFLGHAWIEGRSARVLEEALRRTGRPGRYAATHVRAN